MKRIYLILVLIFSCFVCNAQSEDNLCRNRLKKAQNEYKNGDKEKAKKSIQAIIDYCDDAISADARKWLEDREREEQKRILAEQKAEQERIKREKEEEEARKKIAEQKKKESTSKVTGYTPSYTKKKSSFWDDVSDYFEYPFEGLADYGARNLLFIGVSEVYPISLSSIIVGWRGSDYFSVGSEYCFDYKKGRIRALDYDPTFCYLYNLGFNTKFLSLYCGIGAAYFRGTISWLGDKEWKLGHCLFSVKPSVSLNIPLGDEISLHLNCGYQIFPSKSQLNCLGFGMGLSFE